jgi:hypothetical protein
MTLRKSPNWQSLAAAGIAAFAVAGSLRAADHRDSNSVKNSPLLDINDVFAFRSPTSTSNLVVIVTVHPHARGVTPDPLFAEDARYEIYVSNSPAANPDVTAESVIRVTFSGSPQMFRMTGLGPDPITGPLNQLVESQGARVQCGDFDDPFFFDLEAFTAFVTQPYVPAQGYRASGMGDPVNFFAGANVAAIVIELPISRFANLATGQIKVWAKTLRKQA